MQIKAWTNFKKKINSTARPSDSSAIIIDGYMRNSDPFSIYNPQICFSDTSPGFSLAVPPYNYIYVSDFGNRYYYVVDWVHNKGVWTAALREDCLATEKDGLANHSEYVLRSSAEFDTYIVDTKYPTKSNVVLEKNAIRNVYVGLAETTSGGGYYDDDLFSNTSYDSGCFVISVLGESDNGLTYYALSPTDFKGLMHELFTYNPGDIGEFIGIVLRELVKPIQWITNAYWLPIDVTRLLPYGSRNVTFGPTTFNINCAIVNPINHFLISAIIDIPQHPQVSRGQYLNTSNYTSHTLSFFPFGTFELDASQFISDQAVNGVTITIKIDVATGEAQAFLVADASYLNPDSKGLVAGITNVGFGIPVKLAQSTVDVIGGISAISSTMAPLLNSKESSSVTKEITHNDSFNISADENQSAQAMMGPMGAGQSAAGSRNINISQDKGTKERITTSEKYKDASGTIGGLKSALGHFVASPTAVGSVASNTNFRNNFPAVYSKFSLLVDEDNANYGRPLCKIRTFSSIPGYIQCEDGHYVGKTLRETDEINKFLIGGFFYE